MLLIKRKSKNIKMLIAGSFAVIIGLLSFIKNKEDTYSTLLDKDSVNLFEKVNADDTGVVIGTGSGDSRGGGNDSGSGDSGPGCFAAGTQVDMADGTQKNIEDITIGEEITTSLGASTVDNVMKINHTGDIYALNGSSYYFFTPNHPFMTTSGWKSLDPEMSMKEIPEITVTMLEVGDILLKKGGEEEPLIQLDKITAQISVYNVTVGGAHDYYASGYLVHNKV
jgi:hypothetical protein